MFSHRIDSKEGGRNEVFPVERKKPGKPTRGGGFHVSCLIAGTCAWWACGCGKPETPAPPPPVVEVMEVKPGEVTLSTVLIGQLDSPQNVEVRARVEGFVEEMPFIEGTKVEKDAVLFRLDKKPFLERLAAAKGALGEAEAALNKYQADVRRLTPLYEDHKAIPKQDLDNAMASVDVGLAGVETAKARVQSAEIDLGYCEITAPTGGLVGAKQVSIGELVGKGEPTLLTTISTLNPIWFYCNVSEVNFLKAKEKCHETGTDIEKLPLTLILSSGREMEEPGHFVFFDRAVDPKTGTLRVRAEFSNKDELLRPGMFARVRVNIGKKAGCITVPERALVQLQGRYFVWVVGDDGKARQRPVSVGEQVGPDFLITDGLKPGEKFILEGIQKAREGAPVTVTKAKP